MRPLTIRLLSVRRSFPLFLAVIVCLAIWQAWLTWRLMEQDRNLADQQFRQRLEQVADLAVAQLGSSLDRWELGLRELSALPPPQIGVLPAKLPHHFTLVLLTDHSVASYPHRPLLFVPEPPVAASLAQVFEVVEKLEFQEQNYSRAIQLLRPLTRKPAERPEALLRIARLERRLNLPEQALDDYNRLLGETAANADGVPYALLASGARCELLPHTSAAKDLQKELLEGRWPMYRYTFDYYWSEANRFQKKNDLPPEDSLQFSSLVSEIYQQWQSSVRTGTNLNGREVKPDGSLLLWNATPTRLAALSAPNSWPSAILKLPAKTDDIRWRWLASGIPRASEAHVVRSLAEVKLDEKLEFSSIGAAASGRLNRALWFTGVALMLLLVLAGAYAMHRGVSRELQVAMLQTDFVSAVSHEFRSPLTTLRSITELLVNNRVSDESRVRQSYLFLERETSRLQRLVEDLLDFGRMESGRKQYSILPHDVFSLVRGAVADFREEAMNSGFQVEMSLDSREAIVNADEEALCRAIRNLLENAQKYSPECRTVWVEGHVNHRQVMISVQDKGMGIEARDQRLIFQKFVRGASAKKAGIKGTGIGLSMVRQIVNAFGGEIRLDSVVGVGSTFTIMLPLAGERRNGE